MSCIDNGEDELDYGEEELGDQDAVPSSFQTGGAVSTIFEEEMQPEDYGDLYDDVNIGYLEPSAEIFSRKPVDEGEGLKGHLEVRLAGSVSATKQEVPESSPDLGLPGIGDLQSIRIAVYPSKQEENSTFLTSQPKEGTLVELQNKQSSFTKVADSPAGGYPDVNYLFERQHKVPSVDAVPPSNARTRDEHVVTPISEQDTASFAANDKGDAVGNAANQKPSGDKTFSSQESVRGNGPVLAESSAGIGHLANGNEYGANDEVVTGESPKLAGSANDKGRGFGRIVDGERGRLFQGGGNKDSSSTVANDYLARHGGQSHSTDGSGATMLFVGELHWWTTDAEIQAALSEFGSVKNLKFFEERASGKSKGYCQVEFYDHSAAAACKEGMNGRKFHGRPCSVAFANSKTIVQMGTAQVNKAQAQLQAQAQAQSRRTTNDGGGSSRGGSSFQGGDNSRGYGRMGAGGRGGYGQGTGGKGGTVRGRGNVGSKGMSSNNSGAGGPTYGQGLAGHMGSHPSGIIIPQGMMGQGYDPSYGPPMARGSAGYGGYVLPGPPFPGMVSPFPTIGPAALAGVAPHVNPAFFSRTSTSNGLGMMTGGGVDASLIGLWGDASLNGWGAEEHDRRVREASYGDDIGGSDFGYSGDMVYEKGRANGGRDKKRERFTDGDWDRRRRDDRDYDRERHREKEGNKDQRDRERDWEMDDDWEREKSAKMRNKMQMVEEEDQHLRSREEEYGKRRRLGNER